MTTCCAWCGSVQSVDLVALCRSGLSHGVCVACMPGAFGQEAFKKYLSTQPKSTCILCVNGLEAGNEAGNFWKQAVTAQHGGLNA